jgi:hypothetical protein
MKKIITVISIFAIVFMVGIFSMPRTSSAAWSVDVGFGFGNTGYYGGGYYGNGYRETYSSGYGGYYNPYAYGGGYYGNSGYYNGGYNNNYYGGTVYGGYNQAYYAPSYVYVPPVQTYSYAPNYYNNGCYSNCGGYRSTGEWRY